MVSKILIMERKEELYNYYKSKYSNINIQDDTTISFYTSVRSEYHYLSHGVGVRDLSQYSKIFVHGKDSESLIERLTTSEIFVLKKLEWSETLFTNFDGNIIDRALFLKFEDYFILVGENREKDKLFKWINRFIIKDDIALSNSADDYSLFEIMGEQATSYLTMILGDSFEELSNKKILRVQIDDFFVHGIKVSATAGIDRYIVIVNSINAVRVLNVMEDKKSVFDFGMVGEDAYNLFRIERGIPIVPNELNESVNPFEVNLASSISEGKNSFIGSENISRDNNLLDRLVRLHLTTSFSSEKLPASIVDDGGNNEIGIVTSVANISNVEHPIGLGFVGANFNLNGDKYFAVDENGKYEIKIYEVNN